MRVDSTVVQNLAIEIVYGEQDALPKQIAK